MVTKSCPQTLTKQVLTNETRPAAIRERTSTISKTGLKKKNPQAPISKKKNAEARASELTYIVVGNSKEKDKKDQGSKNDIAQLKHSHLPL